MLRHAYSASERQNLSTNLPDTGRLGVHCRSLRGNLDGRGAITVDGLARNDRGVFASLVTVVLM